MVSKGSFDDPAVHRQHDAVDVGRSRRDQKDSCVRKFLGRADPSQRDLGSLFGNFLFNRRVVVPGAYQVRGPRC